ncbi:MULTISPECIES: tetraacyldisaccharide 4'-kinase [unclassified Candidatus Tisiphia]|uniref:tetraacyldisaccharide 4'-kinase n=1 Tax=unclassified Candidatus Tisiphia TaxID=2996318 RepID=UPI00312C85FD
MIRLIYPKFWHTKNIIAYLLLPLSWLYLFASYLRKIIARPIIFPCKVICVGNISIGGTGKTQIVIFLAKMLKAINIDFIIITKGYGSKLQTALLVEPHHTALDVGDEAVMLLKYGKVIASKKIQYILPFIQRIKPKVIIVDDAMQNPNFYKDIVILSVDADRLFGNELLIPAGPLREYPKQAIEKTDIVILVGSSNVAPSFLYRELPFFQAQIVPTIDIDKTKRYFAFSGIGNPKRFFSTLENYGLQLVGNKIFPDHHQYREEDLDYLKEQSEKSNSLLITTRKDYVKICDTDLSVICCDVHLLLNNQKLLADLIYEKIL